MPEHRRSCHHHQPTLRRSNSMMHQEVSSDIGRWLCCSGTAGRLHHPQWLCCRRCTLTYLSRRTAEQPDTARTTPRGGWAAQRTEEEEEEGGERGGGGGSSGAQTFITCKIKWRWWHTSSLYGSSIILMTWIGVEQNDHILHPPAGSGRVTWHGGAPGSITCVLAAYRKMTGHHIFAAEIRGFPVNFQFNCRVY